MYFNNGMLVNLFAGFIGYAPEIYKLVWDHKVEDTDDDQLYYTQLYLDKELRVSSFDGCSASHNKFFLQSQLSIRLDHRAHIFQNLNGAKDEVTLVVNNNETYLYNSLYDTRSAVYHGNGPSKVGDNY